MRHRVFVGLSGGVDSAVSAALLKEKGMDVVGAFIKIWQPEFIECTWREDRLDAMRVCAALDIPFMEIDLSEQYKKEIVEKMVADYAQGITPNPDVLCNRAIKFGAFADWAREQGAGAIATGHYARVSAIGGQMRLLRALDAAKDQSYFLYTLGQTDLTRAIFPVGELAKSDVRREAKRFELPIADKPDSQGLCFVGEVSMRDFLARYIPLERGRVLDKGGRVVGEHEGAALYTLGQRHGFTDTTGVPSFVTAIDIKNNIIRISSERNDAARASALLHDVRWVYRAPKEGSTVAVQTRYHEEPVKAALKAHAGDTEVSFVDPHIASPGQSLVVYDGEVCLGGGVIVG